MLSHANATPTTQRVPMDHEVLEALKMFRSCTTSSESKPNAKRILKALTLTNPEWKLTHQRMVKILKKEGKPPAKENTCQDANTNKGKATVFSPNTLKKVKAADAPVDPKNVLKTRLRPKSSLSFVYGGARKAKTPTRGETAENEEESETSDPTFVANFEEDEVDSRGPSWVRANQHPAPPLPSPAPVSLKTKAPVAVKLPSPVAATPPPANLPKTKSSSGGFKFNFSGSKSEKTSTTPPRNELFSPAPSTPHTATLTPTPSAEDAASPFVMNSSQEAKEDQGCFVGVKNMCSVM